MNIIVNLHMLVNELRMLNKIVPTKPPVPILTHALLTTDDNRLHFYATDFELSMQTSCPVKVNADGAVALPVARLLAIVEQFSTSDVHIATDEKLQVRIECGAFKSRLQALPAADFPPCPTVEGTSSTLNGPALRQLVYRTRYAVNDGSNKQVPQGALLSLTDTVAAMVATDGKRLALALMPRTGADAQVIIPTKTLTALSAQEGDGEIGMTIGERNIFFQSNGRLLISRMLDGAFPKYERMIPRDNTRSSVVNVQQLSAALRRVGLVAGDDGACYFTFTENGLDIAAASAVGAADEQVAVTFAGEPIKVSCNWQYLLDLLGVCAGTTVTIALKDAKSPLLLTDGDAHLGVVMTMSV